MSVLMANSKGNSSRERVQSLLNKNVELESKRRKAAKARIPSDPNIWQQMRENYEAIVLEDDAFSEQHDIEYALWQLHYRKIEELRALFNAALSAAGSAAPQNGKSPARSGPDRLTKIRSQFKNFLSEATGFYHDLMLKIKAKYGLPLGYFSEDQDNEIPLSKEGSKSSELKKGFISCHRCLIYLGDLARYKGLYGEGDSKARDFAAASSYYIQASSLWPSSGNPHHQLAILAGYSNDELVSIYRYFRSLAVENPFVTARDNLIIAFEKNRQNYAQLLGEANVSTVKMAPSRMSARGGGKGETRSSFRDNRVETGPVRDRSSHNIELFKAFSTRFIRLNGILFTRTSLETFAEVFTLVKNDLLELLSSGPDEEFNFGSDAAECSLAIVRMSAILIFTVHNVNRENENQSYADILQRSVLLQNAFTATFEFMGHILERCYQLNDPSSSYLLPGVMVFVEWLACHQDVAVGSELEEKQMNARSFFWDKCISVFNKLLSSGHRFVNDDDESCFSNMSKYCEGETVNRLALPEDFELRGFVPLLPAQLILDFSGKHSFGGKGGNKQMVARVQRLIAAGKALTNIVRIGQEGVYFDPKLNKFVIGVEPVISDDYLLANPLEPDLITRSVEICSGPQMSLGVLPVPQLGMEAEDEDEDEVIVFRPSISEKHMDDSLKNGVLSVGHDSFHLQSAVTTSVSTSVTVGNGSSHYVPPVQPSIPKWSVEQAPIVNDMSHLNLTENKPSLKSELQDLLGVSQPAALSVPYPRFVKGGPVSKLSTQIPQAVVPATFDSIMSNGAVTDGQAVKPASIMPLGLKKNPVSRPVRHFGPPPGFGSVPSKVVDESLTSKALKNDPASVIDDYRWLDGYDLSSVKQTVVLGNSLNQFGPTFNSVSKSSCSTGIVGFPFPGKQASTLRLPNENQKSWQDYQFSENTNLYEEQQQQVKKGNQPPVGPPHQYPGQVIWDGRFFV